MQSLLYEPHDIFSYILGKSVSVLSFLLHPITNTFTFLLSCTFHSHFFCLFFYLLSTQPCLPFSHKNIYPQATHSLSFPIYSHLHASTGSQKSPHHIFSPFHVSQTWLNFLHLKKKKKNQQLLLSKSDRSYLAPGIIFSTIHTKNKYKENTIPLLTPKYFGVVPVSYDIFFSYPEDV